MVVQNPTPQQSVIVIEPAQPQVVYVPTYNPTVVYGTWPYPSYPPYYMPPPPGYYAGNALLTGMAFGVGLAITNSLWGGYNWGRNDVDINVNRYNNVNVNRRITNNQTSFTHNSAGRKGVPYRDAKVDQKYGKNVAGKDARNDYRGRDANDAKRDAARDTMAQRTNDPKTREKLQQEGAGKAGDGARDRASAGSDRSGGAAPDRAAAAKDRAPGAGSRIAAPAAATRCRRSKARSRLERQRAQGCRQRQRRSAPISIVGRPAVRPRPSRRRNRSPPLRRHVRRPSRRQRPPVRRPSRRPARACRRWRRSARTLIMAYTHPPIAVEASMSLSLKHLFAAWCVALFVAAAPGVAHAQQSKFPSAEAAAEAFVDAIARSDDDAMRAILGADYRKVLPLDEVSQDDKLDFLSAWAQGHRVVAQAENKAVLEVGKTHWSLPIPMVKGSGGWVFDTRAGADEMITRRIGRNELSAMEAVLAYFDAQKEYARKERQPGMGLVYAQKFFSTPGKKDGLYWDDGGG